jgi:hypothetical protein
MDDALTVAKIEHAGRRVRKHSVRGHRLWLPANHVTTVEGTRVTTVERTLVDCAALVNDDHLLAMGDCAAQSELLDHERLDDVLTWAAGRRGIRRARSVAGLIRMGVESPQESRLRWLLIVNELPEPDINPWIVVDGERAARLDLAYLSARIGIEYDGDWHAETRDHDVRRRNMLAREGWAIVVARKEDLESPDRLLKEIRELFRDRQVRRKRRW